MNAGTFFTTFALAGLLITMPGCFKKKASAQASMDKSFRYSLNVASGAALNPDPQGNPMSVVVRIYHLKDKGEFNKLTFEMLNRDSPDQEPLGADFLTKQEIVVLPGSQASNPVDMPSGTRFVGAVALFRNPDPQYWRVLLDVNSLWRLQETMKKAKKKKGEIPSVPVDLKVDGNSLSLVNLPPERIPGQEAPQALNVNAANTNPPAAKAPGPGASSQSNAKDKAAARKKK